MGVTLAVHERTKLASSGRTEAARRRYCVCWRESSTRQRGGRAQAGTRARSRRAGRPRAARARPPVADALYRSQAELQLERLAGELAASAHEPQRLRELELEYDDALTALSAAQEPDRALVADLLGELGCAASPSRGS